MLKKFLVFLSFALVVALFAWPLHTSTKSMNDASAVNINLAKHELLGDEYLRPLYRLLVTVSAHKTLVRDSLSGKPVPSDEIRRVEVDIDQAFKALLAT